MAIKKILSAFLIVVFLASSIYFMMPDKVRIDIEKTRTKYSVWENEKWVLAATEYVNLYDGTTKMRARSRELNYWNDSEFAYVQRISIWKDGIETIQTYKFKIDGTEVEQFPIENLFECFNCEKKIVHYEIRDILYTGETRIIDSPFSFGHNMKIEWQDGAYYSKVFQQKIASDKIIIKYRPKKDYEKYKVRLFDPSYLFDGLISWWKFDDTYFDELGINNGTNSGTTFSSGKINNAAVFDSTDKITVGTTGFPSGDSSRSYSMWINPTSVSIYQTVFLTGTYSNNNMFGLNFFTTDTLSVWGHGNDHDGTFVFETGNWYHVVVTYDSSTSTLKTYINGNIDIDEVTNNFNTAFGIATIGYSLTVSGRTFNGRIDEFATWDYALNQTAVDDLYNFDDGLTYPFIDTIPPTFITIPSNASLTYRTALGVSFNATDETEFDTYFINWTDTFQINSTGYLSNSSPLILGIYEINVSINDTAGNVNYTIWKATIIQNTGACDVFFNETSPLEYMIKFKVYSNCNSAFILYRNGTIVANNSEQYLGVETYNFTVTRNDTANYSNIYDDEDFTINKANPSGDITGDTFMRTGDESTVVGNETNVGDSDMTYILYRDGVSVSNPDILTLPTGVYNYVYNTTGGTNYTANSSLDTLILTVIPSGFWYEGNNISDLSLELGTSVNLLANITGATTICLDIDHPEYGDNYTCGSPNISFIFDINYFRKTIFNDSSLSTKLNYIGTENFDVFFSGHLYDEVISMAFNISGENSPTNIQINKSNTTEIDRYYDGVLTGSSIYLNHDEDNATAINLTYSSGAIKNIYFQIDENASDVSVLFNITGLEFGLEYYEDWADSFSDWADIDTDLTTAKLDVTGLILPANTSKQYSYYDTYDGSINGNLWGTYVSSGTTGTNSETGIYIQSNLAYSATGSFSNHEAIVYTNNPNFISMISSDEIRFRIISDYDGIEDQTDRVTGHSKIYIGQEADEVGLIWTSSYLQSEKDSGSYAEKSDADLNFIITKHNGTHWNVEISGIETSFVQNYGPCAPTEYPANGVWNWTSGVSTITCSGGSSGPFIGSLDNSFYVVINYSDNNAYTGLFPVFIKSIASKATDAELTNMITRLYPINKSSYYVKNLSIYSKSVYDASGDITDATFNFIGWNVANSVIYLYLSADNGENWENVEDNVQHSFSNTGRHLKWRVEFNTTTPGFNPAITSMSAINLTTPKGFPTNILIDFGADGTTDYNWTSELNSSNSPIRINISNPDISGSSLVSGYPHLLRVPVEIISSTPGQINIDIINITYNPNPVYLDVTSIMNYLSGASGMFSFLINIMSINGNITIDDIRYDYAGGNDTIEIVAWESINSNNNVSMEMDVYYSYWDYSWVPNNIDYIYFGPISSTEKNVTAWGQNEDIPILNITNYGYGGKNTTLSVYLNDTLSCVNMTLSLTENKTDGVLINNSWIDLTNMTYLQTVNVSLWADYECDDTTWRLFDPYISFRQCCEDCICSTEVV